MGTLKSTTDVSGMEVNGVILGSPTISEDETPVYSWDDSMLPNGTIDVEGNITPDEEVNL